MGKQWKQWQTLFSRALKSLWMVTVAMKLKDAGRVTMTDLDNILKRRYIKKHRHPFADKGPSSQSYGFSSSHIWMWELDHKEDWVQKNWCLWTVVLEKTLESPLDCKKIKPVNPKGNKSWIFIGKTDAEAEAPILWPPDAKNWLIRKDPYARKVRAGEKGDDRGWDGWMVSLTQWTWIWGNSRRWWRAGEPGMLQSMGSQRVRHK